MGEKNNKENLEESLKNNEIVSRPDQVLRKLEKKSYNRAERKRTLLKIKNLLKKEDPKTQILYLKALIEQEKYFISRVKKEIESPTLRLFNNVTIDKNKVEDYYRALIAHQTLINEGFDITTLMEEYIGEENQNDEESINEDHQSVESHEKTEEQLSVASEDQQERTSYDKRLEDLIHQTNNKKIKKAIKTLKNYGVNKYLVLIATDRGYLKLENKFGKSRKINEGIAHFLSCSGLQISSHANAHAPEMGVIATAAANVNLDATFNDESVKGLATLQANRALTMLYRRFQSRGLFKECPPNKENEKEPNDTTTIVVKNDKGQRCIEIEGASKAEIKVSAGEGYTDVSVREKENRRLSEDTSGRSSTSSLSKKTSKRSF